jgi:hypothetical protein
MTAEEYADYCERVDRYLSGCEAVSTGPCPGCEDCGLPADAEEYDTEPFFSWHPCEICATRLGGDREPWHCVIDGKIVHGICCEDCAYFINYGHLDDKTMLSIDPTWHG